MDQLFLRAKVRLKKLHSFVAFLLKLLAVALKDVHCKLSGVSAIINEPYFAYYGLG